MSTASWPFCLATFIRSLALRLFLVLRIVQLNTVPAPPSTVFGQSSRTLCALRRSLLMFATPLLTSVLSLPQPEAATSETAATATPPPRQALYLTDRPPHSFARRAAPYLGRRAASSAPHPPGGRSGHVNHWRR